MLEYSILIGALSKQPSGLTEAAVSEDAAPQVSSSTTKTNQISTQAIAVDAASAVKVKSIASPELIPTPITQRSSQSVSPTKMRPQRDRSQKPGVDSSRLIEQTGKTTQAVKPQQPSQRGIEPFSDHRLNPSLQVISDEVTAIDLAAPIPPAAHSTTALPTQPAAIVPNSTIFSAAELFVNSSAESSAVESAALTAPNPLARSGQPSKTLSAEENQNVANYNAVSNNPDPELGTLRLTQSETSLEVDQNRLENNADPELGRLRLQKQASSDSQSPEDAELGNLRLRETIIQPRQNRQAPEAELGNLRLREVENAQPETKERSNSVFLTGRVDYFNSDNIFLDNFAPVDDQLLTAELSIFAAPTLGPRTQLIAAVEGSIARYNDLSESDFNKLEFQLGVRQFFLPRTYGEISWRNQQFFSTDGDQFLNDHSIQLSLDHRENLTPQLSLDGFYQFRLSLAEPVDRSRIYNTLGLFLNYSIDSNIDVGLGYQLALTDYTQFSQNDTYHQVTAQVSYDLNRYTRVSLYGGLSFGRSSNPAIDFDSSIVGLTVNFFVPVF